MLVPYVVLGVVTGLVSAGEAVALFVGVGRRPDPGSCDWIRANRRMLLADLALGGALAIGAMTAAPGRTWVLIAAVLLAVTHGFRLWQHMAERPCAFAFNFALAAANALELFGALAFLAVASRLGGS